MKKILGIGNALVDILIPITDDALLDELDLPKGSMVLVDRKRADRILERTKAFPVRQSSGGSAANTVHGLARLGVPCGFFGSIGGDDHGRFFEEDLRANGIEPHLTTLELNTGKAISLISTDTERTFATFLGAAGELHPRTLSPSYLRQFHTLHMEGYLLPIRHLSEKIFALAADLGVKISLDFSSYNIVEENREYFESVVRNHVDIALANEDEARVFTGGAGAEDAVEQIARLCGTAVVKCGAGGSWAMRSGEKIFTPAIEARPADTTGAGDLFAAGFLFGLLLDLPLASCGRIGSLLGGRVVEVIGAKMGETDWKDIKQHLDTDIPGLNGRVRGIDPVAGGCFS